MQQSHKKGKSDENTHDPAILAQALPIAAFQTVRGGISEHRTEIF